MAAIVRALSATARRAPLVVVVVVVVLTGVLGFFAGQVEQDQSQESFSPDNETLTAQQFAGEVFEGSTSTVVQIVVEADDDVDVVSPEGLETASALREAILADVPAEQLSAAQGGSPIVTWMLPVEQSVASGQVPEQALGSDDGVDQVYLDAVEQLPAEATGLSAGLVATEDDQDAVDASTALALVFLETEAIVGDAEGQTAQTEAIVGAVEGVVDVVDGVDAPLDTSAFAFELFFRQDDSFTQEIGRLFATAAAIIVIILFLVYLFPPRGSTSRVAALRRAAADTGLTLFVIFASIGWMQGIGVLLGPAYLDVIGAFSPPTQIIPILLIGLGVDYAIHVSSRYREEIGEGASVDRAVERASTTVGVALLLATMTTVLGFLTNVANPVPAIADFGILAAVGIFVAFLLMLTFLPAVRVLLDRRAEKRDELPREALGASSESILSRITESTAVLGERFAWGVVVLSLVLGGVGGYGLTQLSTEFSFADFVPEDNPVRATFLTIEEEFTGGFGEQTQVVVDGTEGDGVATPAVHNATVESIGALADVEGVITIGENAAAQSLVSSIGTQLQLAAFAQQAQEGGAQPGGDDGQGAGAGEQSAENTGGEGAGGQEAGGAAGGPPGQQPSPEQLQAAATFTQTATQLGLDPQTLTVADDADVAAIYDALFEADPAAGAVLAQRDGSYIASQAVVQTQSGAVGADVLADDVEEAFSPVADAGPDVTPTGNQIITDAIIGDLSASQVSSLGLTLVAALVLLVLVFGIRDRRPLLGAITLFPVGLVLLWVFGMMAATGIPFGPVTSTISGLAIGIGVPFTIHITNRFVEDLEVEPDVPTALRSTLRHTGGALAGSALTTAAGFAILVTSSLTPFQQLGLVVAYAIGFSLLASILVLPSYLAIWARARGIGGAGSHDRSPTPAPVGSGAATAD